jgi:hypothetical protein
MKHAWTLSLILLLAACNTASTPAPVIQGFSAVPDTLPAGGGEVTLGWTVEGATSLAIDNGVGAVTGTSITVTVTVSTTFTLTASNASGTATKATTVTVLPPASLAIDPPARGVVAGGPGVLFTANIVGAQGTVTWTLSGPGSVAPESGPSTTYTPPASVDASETATLTAALADPALSAEVTITVNPAGTAIDTTPPIVSLSSSRSEITAPGAITLSASASDDVGVSKVVFFEGTTRLGEDDSAPYSFERRFGAADTGTFGFTAVAFDAVGNSGSSQAVTVAVSSGAPGGGPPPGGRPVVIPPTTKVADSATQDALGAFDPDSGTMRFTENTLQLQSLRPDDVLVGEPSEAAPYGYLRKVKTIRREGAGVVLETTQANLTDAVHQGDLDAAQDLKASDLESATALVEGLSVGLAPQDAIDIGDGYNFKLEFDETVLDIAEGDVKVKVRVDGVLYFNAGYNIGIGIDNINPREGRLTPEVDRFEAWIGFDQASILHVSGEANAKITKEKKVAEYRFETKCFLIGPVPVCVTPTVYAFVGASGEVNLSFDYRATQTAAARVGAKWTDDRGWEDIKPTPSFNTTFDQQFTVNAALNAKAYTKTEGALMFYNAAGPTIGVKSGIELDAAIPRNPFWILRGNLDAYYGFIVDLPVIGRVAESNGTLYSLSKEFGRSPNAPPKFSNVKSDVIQASIGVPIILGPRAGFTGYFDVADPEGEPITLGATSDRDGAIPLNVTFRSGGLRTVTVTAKDKAGASASITLKVNVGNSLPIVDISVATDSIPATVDYFVTARAYDPESSGYLGCDRLVWSVSAPDTVTPQPKNGSCDAVVVFANEGTRTLTVTATDPHGGKTSKTLTVFVSKVPENRPPVIDGDSFSVLALKGPRDPFVCGIGAYCEVPDEGTLWNGQQGDYHPPLYLSVNASDPEGDPLTIQWFCKAGDRRFPITDHGDGTFSCEPTYTTNLGVLLPVVIWADVSDGTSTVSTKTRTLGWLRRVN